MKNLHSNRKQIKNILKGTEMEEPNDIKLDYYKKRFSSPVSPHMKSKLSIPPFNNAQNYGSRNELGKYCTNKSNILEEIRGKQKISTRETYFRKPKNLFATKRRSKTVRGSQVIPPGKFKSILKSINK